MEMSVNPQGQKFLARDATPEMIDAAVNPDPDVYGSTRTVGERLAVSWAAMWDAAPPTTAESRLAELERAIGKLHWALHSMNGAQETVRQCQMMTRELLSQ